MDRNNIQGAKPDYRIRMKKLMVVMMAILAADAATLGVAKGEEPVSPKKQQGEVSLSQKSPESTAARIEETWKHNAYDDAFFFGALLNLDAPGLDAVKDAARTEDWAGARQALLAYFRARKAPRLAPNILQFRHHPPAGIGAIEAAERALNREFWVRDRWITFGHPIAWRKPPVDSPHDLLNYVHQLNRMYFLSDLAAAFRESGEERYARGMIELLDEFIDGNPLPKLKNYAYPKQYGWSQISASYRFMYTWSNAMLALLESRALTPETFVKFMKALHQNIEFVRKHHVRGGNHCTFEVGCLFMAGVLWPEFARSEHWREYGLEWLQRQAGREHYPDGFIKEMSCSYHSSYGLLVRPIEFARFNGVEVDFPAEYFDVVRRAARAQMLMLKPDGTIPRYGDSVGRDKRDEVLEYGDALGDQEMLWVGSRGQRGRKPSVTSYFFPDARYAIMRSGWEEDADFLIMDCGPAGSNHRNRNQLAVELCARGIHWIENPGYGRRNSSPLYRWRAQDSRSHSTLNIAGASQQYNKDADGYMVSDPAGAFDYAVGWYKGGYIRMTNDHQETGKPITGVRHTRRVLYLRGEYWLVVDSLDGDVDGDTAANIRWTFPPSQAGFDPQSKRVWTEQQGKRLLISSADPEALEVRIAEGEEKPYVGWWSPGTQARRYETLPAPEAIITRKGPLPLCFATVLAVEDPGTASPRITASSLSSRASGRIRIEHARGCDLVAIAPSKGQALTVEEVPALSVDAKLMLVRLDREQNPRLIHATHVKSIQWHDTVLWEQEKPADALSVSFKNGEPVVATPTNDAAR